MHETGIALEIHRMAREAIDSGHIECVRIALGERAGVDPALLRLAWSSVTHASVDSGAELHIDWSPVRRHCPRCRTDRRNALGSWLPICPACRGPLSVTGGDELDLLEVAWERDDSRDATDAVASDAPATVAGGLS